MSAVPRIVSFRESVEPQNSVPEASRLLSGAPRVTAWNHYAEDSGQFFAGIWAATRGSWRVRYSEHEFCHLLSGRVAITSDAGVRCEFSPGDSFVIPAGFSGIWEVLEDCRKLYALFEGAAQAGG
jgi:uncharacterized cupin superfamily protein